MSSSSAPPRQLCALLLLSLSLWLSVLCRGTAAQANANGSAVALTLPTNSPYLAQLPASSFAYFNFTPPAGSPNSSLVLSIAAAFGFPTLYASNSAQPSAATAQYSAASNDGGAVLIAPVGAAVWYLTVASGPQSASNVTVVASVYDPTLLPSTAIPLANAVSQTSLVTAGSYRYYTYTLSGTSATQLSISVTQSNSDVLILVNLPGNPALPTIIQCDVTSSSITTSTLQQLVTLLAPAQGVYSVGVWSATDSSFAITAVTAGTLSIQPLPYGVVFPGYVLSGAYQYYSVYVDPLQLQGASLRLSLYSLSGDADLYCSSTTAYPTSANSRWQATSADPLDQLDIGSTQLVSGTIYCAVNGYGNSSYTLAANLQTPILLSPEDVIFVQTIANDTTDVFITLEASSDPNAFIVVSVAAQYGATSLYANGYPRAAVPTRQGSQWVSALAQPLQALPLVIADVCNAGAIPGTDPKLCGINLLIISPVDSLFRIGIEVNNGGVYLQAGQAYPGALKAGGLFVVQFEIPNNFLNASLLVTLADPADSASISVGRNSWDRNSSLWTVTNTPGSPVVFWFTDWTDTVLTPPGSESGVYYAFISASANTTLTVLYTLSNGTGYNGAPTQLVAGEPQYGVLPRGGLVSFYTFRPPATGWPYVTLISCDFVTGGFVGQLLTTTGDGYNVGPSPGSYQWYGRQVYTTAVVTVAATDTNACNPNRTLASGKPCLYQMSVQAPFGGSGPLEYYITATTSSSLRTISTEQTVSSTVAAGSVEYWLMSYYSYGRLRQQVAAATVTQGQAVVYGSNISLPTASNAQLQAVAQPTGLLSLQSVADAGNNYYFVGVNCSAGVDCVYSMQYSQYQLVPLPPPTVYPLGIGAPTSALLGPGRLAYFYVDLNSFTAVGYALLQLQTTVGSVTLYAALGATYPNVSNPASYQWSTTSPNALSITNLNLTGFTGRVASRLAIVAQAGASSAATLTLSLDVAGVSATVVGPLTSLLTPAFPVSYFTFNLPFFYVTTALALGFYTSTCPASTQLYVSDRLPQPGPGQPGVTYNYTGTRTVVAGNLTQVVVEIANSSALFAASPLRLGPYYFAVVSDEQSSCSYQVDFNIGQLFPLQADVQYTNWLVYGDLIGTNIWTFSMQPNTDVSFGLRLAVTTTPTPSVLVYAAVDALPDPLQPSSYVAFYNQSTATAVGGLSGSLYLPGSLCPATNQSRLLGCQVVLLTRSAGVNVLMSALSPMVTAAALAADQTVVSYAAPSIPAYYRLPVPAGAVGTISLAIFTSAVLQVYCSYQFIRPSALFYDWTATTGLNSSSSTVDFTWSAPQLNPINGVAPAATTCYCSLASSATAGFTVAMSFTTSRPSGLSTSSLFAAIFVPVVVTAVMLLALLWLARRRGCFGARALVGKEAPAHASTPAPATYISDQAAPMSELQPVGHSTRARVTQSTLLNGGQFRSDA